MRYKKIPKANLEVSVVSLGTWVFGADEWGGASEKECIEAVNTAVDCGINLIDTAPVYGQGKSERIVGKAIKGKRAKLIIATKCGLIGKGKNIAINLKPASIRKEIEESLRRLEVDYVDLYQCHWPDPHTPIEQTMNEMSKLKKEGKIRHIGLSNFDLNLLRQAAGFADIVTIQNHYSLLERSIEKDILPYCKKQQIGVLSYGSLGGGILSGKYSGPASFQKNDARSFFYKFYKGEEFKKANRTLTLLKELSGETKKPLNQIALNWINQKEAVISAIAGCRDAEQARTNAYAGEWVLSEKEIGKFDSNRTLIYD